GLRSAGRPASRSRRNIAAGRFRSTRCERACLDRGVSTRYERLLGRRRPIAMANMTAISPLVRGGSPEMAAALAVGAIAAVTLAGAWYFQLVLGLQPCPLCLEQRYAYYLAVPLAVLVALAAG